VPDRGLIVSNHLGYVDILVIGSVCSSLFVAKSDVRGWPIFGWLTLLAGTLYVQRQIRSGVEREIHTISSRLMEGYPVVIFPEGTSSDGLKVLPFKSSFFQSLHDTGSPVTPAAISYGLDGPGCIGAEIAYWGEMTLVPHLLNILSMESFKAVLSFGETHQSLGNRKEDATCLHAKVSELLSQIQRDAK
jgi:1-acyl-sn-glycerol-3-phosphate acyltransferase